MTEFRLHPRVAQVAVQMMARLLATFAVIEGFVIIVGGKGRWSDLGHQVALAVPGAPATWGFFLLGAGVISFMGSFLDKMRLAALGMFLGGVWSLFFALAFGWAATIYDSATNTAAWTYGALGIMYLLIAMAYHQSSRPPARHHKAVPRA